MELFILIFGTLFGFFTGYIVGAFVSPVLKKRGILIIYDDQEDFANLISKLNSNVKTNMEGRDVV